MKTTPESISNGGGSFILREKIICDKIDKKADLTFLPTFFIVILENILT